MTSKQVIVTGSCNGKLTMLLNFVNKMNAKNKYHFVAVFCIGPFFPLNPQKNNGDSSENEILDFLKSDESLPIPTYFFDDRGIFKLKNNNLKIHFIYKYRLILSIKIGEGFSEGLPLINEGRHNIYYMETSGIKKLECGLTVAYYMGSEEAASIGSTMDATKHVQQTQRIQKLKDNLKQWEGEIEFFFSTQWPDHFNITLKSPNNKPNVIGSTIIKDLVCLARPRYHFISDNKQDTDMYKRSPYLNPDLGTGIRVTRLIYLPQIKQKSLHSFMALDLVPGDECDTETLTSRPDDTTDFPYDENTIKEYLSNSNQASRKRRKEDMSNVHKKARTDFKLQPFHQAEEVNVGAVKSCWFCLGNMVDKSLLVSVGSQCYLATDKGPVTEDHCLIIPIKHYNKSISMPEIVRRDITDYITSLRRYYESKNLSLIAFERFMNSNNRVANHAHINVISITNEKAEMIDDVFLEVCKEQRVDINDFIEVSGHANIHEIGQKAGNEFYYIFTMPDGKKKIYSWQYRQQKITRYPITFGRNVFANLCGKPERSDWKSCIDDEEKASDRTAEFRKLYKPFEELTVTVNHSENN